MADGADIAKTTAVRVVVAATNGSTPRETGAAMLVWPDGQHGTIGGGVLEWNAAKHAREMLLNGTKQSRQSVALGPDIGQCCGGRVELLFTRSDELPPCTALPVYLYGAGHVGREIARVLQGLPFALTWIDIDLARYPDQGFGAKRLVKPNPAAAVAHAPDTAYHFVLTHSHAHDLEICHQVLSRRFGHLGLIGSASKKARFLKRLRELGHAGAVLDRLQCPIGDKRLGKTPQAIAIGVAHWLMHANIKANEPRGEGRA